MKSLHCQLLAIMAVSFVAPTVVAGVEGFKLNGYGVRKPIFAHTGQDPVYRSLGEDDIFDKPFERKYLLDQQPSFDLVHVIMQNALQDLDWTSVPSGSVIPESSFEESLLDWSVVQIPISVPFQATPIGSSIPAPPAFLLLLSGVAIHGRRRK